MSCQHLGKITGSLCNTCRTPWREIIEELQRKLDAQDKAMLLCHANGGNCKCTELESKLRKAEEERDTLWKKLAESTHKEVEVEERLRKAEAVVVAGKKLYEFSKQKAGCDLVQEPCPLCEMKSALASYESKTEGGK